MKKILKFYLLRKNVTFLKIKCEKINYYSCLQQRHSSLTNLVNNNETMINKNESLLSKYHETIEKNFFQKDPHQLAVVQKLDDFHSKIISYTPSPQTETSSIFASFKGIFSKDKAKNIELIPPQIKGIYLYGGVG